MKQKTDKLSFSLTWLLSSIKFWNKKEDILYFKSKKLLYEYTDLKSIIRRLQDIDKMKAILFTKDQKNLFDLIPKPEIDETNIGTQNKSFGIENIIKNTKKSLKEKSSMRTFNSNLSEVDKKIIELMDESMLRKLNIK